MTATVDFITQSRFVTFLFLLAMLWNPFSGTRTDYLRRKQEDKTVKFTNHGFGSIGLV
ncbi:hypothetical protein BRE01_05030 [Brevibacillus reuszeri]|uniref:Uncharacterized protein n=1 Tax=Brevibacillus reuszeri TaxID=54915 RepID=A0ABQ0TFW5_9BACL|nr:hypothetical protein BRE01_05030 [Brevibacillus reuszeri]